MTKAKKNIVLTGFMGTGKTAVGRELARMLDMKLVDIDSEIEAEEGMKISEIFGRFGEQYFRDAETRVIRRISQGAGMIISTGGGAVLREENIELLRRNAAIFCLAASPETILARTSGNTDRPLLQVEDPMSRIRELLAYRRPFYEKAGDVIDTDGKTPLQVAGEIVEKTGCRR